MQSAAPTRKRPAPGASPMVQPPATSNQSQYQHQQQSDNQDYSNFDFNAFPADQQYTDPSIADVLNYSTPLNSSQPPNYASNIGSASSTDLVRRVRNQQIAPQNGQQEQWNEGIGNMGGQQPQEEEDEQDLDMKVALAKRNAQGKPKQIPPFVQKLSSFLDNANTHLIRWSDDGRSFIVLDEDEFARTLIPELFKHNNYASFVRQLNMYGFHKTVNITDGSLRQSEKARKGVKPPSMYSHPYFRKNRPDLLWLIQKPTGKAGVKRKRDGNLKDGADSDDERQFSPAPDGRPLGELGIAGGQQDITTMPQRELLSVRTEIKKLQQQQSIISRMIAQLKEQNDRFYRQATAFQALHDRHENSINAILTFLATFYNRSLEGHAGPNLVNMFGNANDQTNQQRDRVVEEYNDNPLDIDNQIQRYVKKPQLLLTDGQNRISSPYLQPGTRSTEPGSAQGSVRPSRSPPSAGDSPASRPEGSTSFQSRNTAAGTSVSPVIKDDAPTPDYLYQVPDNNEHMMNLINDVAAGSAGQSRSFDFNNVLNHYQTADGNAPLTAEQRDNMLSMIAKQQGLQASDNNALVSSSAPLDARQMGDSVKQNLQSIDLLSSMQGGIGQDIQTLSQRVGSFSPSGTIPGLENDANFGDPAGWPSSYDPNSFMNWPTDDNADLQFASNPDNFENDWDVDGAAPNTMDGAEATDMFQDGTGVGEDGLEPLRQQQQQQQRQQYAFPNEIDGGGGKVESLSSQATSPAATTGQMQDETELAAAAEPTTPNSNKRQRRS